VIRLLVSILITAILILVLFSQISFGDFYALFFHLDPGWALSGCLGYVLSLLFRALRIRWLVHSKDLSLSQSARLSVLHNFSLMILPSKLGELAYPYLLNRMCGITLTEGLASLITARIYDFFITFMMLLISAMGFPEILKINVWVAGMIAVSCVSLTFLTLFHMSRLSRWVSAVFETLSSRVRFKRRNPFPWIRDKASHISADFDAIHSRRGYVPVTLLTTLSWLMAFWMFYSFLRGFGISISFLNVIFGSSVALFVNALPISGVGNWGILEAGWAAGFLIVGLSKEKAIATGFGVHILIFIITGLLALLCWTTWKQQSPSPAA
jgi:glycosyltransferase 2 family protein